MTTGPSPDLLLGELEAARMAWADVLTALDSIGGPNALPSYRTEAWIRATQQQRLTALALLGHRELLAQPGHFGADYAGGKYHRNHDLPELSELDRRRWAPTGDRALWVRYGDAGPPSVIEGVRAA